MAKKGGVKKGHFEYTIGFRTDDTVLRQTRQALKEIQKLTTESPGMEKMGEELKNAQQAAAQLENALTRSFNIKMGTTDIVRFNQILKQSNIDLKTTYERMASIGPVGEAAFNKFAVSTMTMNMQIKKGNTLLEKFGKTLLRNVEWLISGGLINSITGVFTQAYGYTKNLDASLNDIRIVTGQGADEMARFGEEARKTASELGKGTTDITKASLIYYQQGLDDEEVKARTEISAKMSNVTGQSAEQISNQMTAVWNGFRAGTDELEHFADVLTAVAANTASNSSELTSSISKVASIANTTGVDMEQLTAMLSTVISVTRETPETVGTAFKTIFARINDLVEDGTDEFGVTLGRISSHLKAMGIEILDEDGKLRDLGDTLTEIGENWSYYNQEQQVAIAEQIGGKRQWGQVIALFNSWDKYSEALNVAKNSTGALQEQQDIYMERTTAHLQAVKTAWEGVYNEMMTPENINAVADTIVNTLDGVRNLIQALGGMKPILTTISGLMVQAFSSQIAQNVVRIADNMRKTDYNDLRKQAEQELIGRFRGVDQNNALLKEMTDYHAKILTYQSSMTKEQRDYYKELMNSRMEAEGEYNVLKKQNEELIEIEQKYDYIYKKRKEDSKTGATGGSDIQEDINARIGALKDFRENQYRVMSGSKSFSLDYSKAEQNAITAEMNALIKLNDALKMAEDKVTESEEKLQRINSHLKESRGDLAFFTDSVNRSIDRKQEIWDNKDMPWEEKKIRMHDIDQILERDVRMRDSIGRQIPTLEDSKGKIENQIDKQIEQYVELENRINSVRKAMGDIEQNPGDVQIQDKLQAEIKETIQLYEQLYGKENSGDFTRALQELQQVDFTSPHDKIEAIIAQLKEWANNETIVKSEAESLIAEYVQLKSQISINGFVPDASAAKFEELRQKIISATKVTEEELNKILQGYENKVPVMTKSLEMQLKSLKAEMAEFQTGLNFQALTQSATQMLGAFQQLSGAIMNIKNLGNILSNKDLAPWEKSVQIIQNLSSVLLTSLYGFSSFRKGLVSLTSTVNDAALRSYAYGEAQKWVTLKTQGLNEEQAKALLMQELLTKAKTEEEKETIKLAYANSSEEVLTEALTAAKAKEIVATNAENFSKKKLIVTIGELIKAKVALLAASLGMTTGLFVGAMVVAIIAITKLIVDIKQLIEVQKEADESQKKLNETREDFIKKNKELIEVIDEDIKAFGKFEEVWKSFQEGTTTVDELKEALKGLAEEFGVTDDAEYKRLMRIAEYENDFSEVEQYFEKKAKKKRDNEINANKQITEQYQKDLNNTIEGIQNESELPSKHIGSSNMAEDFIYDSMGYYEYLKESGLPQFLEKNGIASVYYDGHGASFTNTFTEESLRILADNRQRFEDMVKNENRYIQETGQYYLDIINRTEGTLKLLNDTALQKALKEGEQGFEIVTGSSEERKVQLEKQINDIIDEMVAKNPDLNIDEERKQAIHDQLLQDYVELYPSSKDIVGEIESDKEATESITKAFTEAFDSGAREVIAKRKHINKSAIKELSKEEIKQMQSQLEEAGIKPFTIDWEAASENTELFAKIIDQRGQLTEEDINNLLQYKRGTDEVVEGLTLDYDSLIATYDDFSKKIEKGTFNAKDFNTKAFQDFFSDDVKKELKAFYGETSEVAEAIDLLGDKSLIGTVKWEEAWEIFGRALDNAQNKEAIKNFDEQVDGLLEKVQILQNGETIEVETSLTLDGTEFQEKMEKILSQDYSTTVTIDAQIDDTIDEMHEGFSKIVKEASKIGENFSLPVDDFNEILETFPELAEGISYLEDGTIQLSQTSIKAMIDTQKANEKVEVQKKIDTIREENAIIKKKIDTYEQMITIAQHLARGEIDTQKEVNEDITALDARAEDLKLYNHLLGSIEDEKLMEGDIQDWEKFYEQLDKDDKAFWEKVLERKREAIKNNSVSNVDDLEYDHLDWSKLFTRKEGTYEFEKDGVVYGALQYRSQKDDEEEVIRRGKRLEKLYTDQKNELQKIYNENLTQVSLLEAEKNAVDAKWNNLYNSWKEKDTTKDKTTKDKATKDKKEKEEKETAAEMIDLLEKEIDLYHDIDQAIQKHSTTLNRLQKQQSKLTGSSLIENMKKQLNEYDDLNEDIKEKISIKNLEAASIKIQLQDYGAIFNPDDTIANYSQLLNNELISINKDRAWYNSLSGDEQKNYKDWVKDREDEYKKLEDLIKNYDQITGPGGDIEKLADDITENIDKKVELQLSIAKQEVEIVINKGSLKRSKMELQKALSEIQNTDIAGNLAYDINTIFSYSESGELEAIKKRFEKAEAMIEEYRTKGTDPDARMEQEYKEALDQYLNYVKDMNNKTAQLVTNTFDRLNKKLERQKAQFEAISKIFEHDMNLIKLKYGEKAYEQLKELYAERTELAQAQADNAELAVKTAKKELQEARLTGRQDLIEQAEDKLRDSLATQREAIENYLNAVKEEAENTINTIFNHLDERITGVSLDKIKKEWDNAAKDFEDYYDTINGAYEIEKLRSKMKEAINNTDSIATQQSLNKLMNEEIIKLQQKDKLSKYDIERANALFDIEQKRAAFREAQNNKSKMRLRRDSSGNYSYQFVSDEDKVTSAMQDLADAQNSLYNIDKEAYKNNLDKMYEYYEQFQEELKEASSAEEREEIEKRYITRISELQQETIEITTNLQDTALKERERLTGESLDNIAQMEKDVIVKTLIPEMDTYLAKLAQSQALIGSMEDAAHKVFDVQEGVQVAITTAGVDIGNLTQGIDQSVYAIETMTESTDVLAEEIDNISRTLEDIVRILTGQTTQNTSQVKVNLPTNYSSGYTLPSGSVTVDTSAVASNSLGTKSVNTASKVPQDLWQAYSNIQKDIKTLVSDVTVSLEKNLKSLYTDRMKSFAEIVDKLNLLIKINEIKDNIVDEQPREIHINANFPNVNLATEIEKAFEMLMNEASQEAYRVYR